MNISSSTTPRSQVPITPVTDLAASTSRVASRIEENINVDEFDFAKMSRGDFEDALNELLRAGRITLDEAGDLCLATFFSCPTGMSFDDYMKMPIDISHDRIREQIEYAEVNGFTRDRDSLQRGLDLLMQLQGTPRRLDATA